VERKLEWRLAVYGRFDDSDSNLCRLGERCVGMVDGLIGIHFAEDRQHTAIAVGSTLSQNSMRRL
jgi:hypothetical protein